MKLNNKTKASLYATLVVLGLICACVLIVFFPLTILVIVAVIMTYLLWNIAYKTFLTNSYWTKDDE